MFLHRRTGYRHLPSTDGSRLPRRVAAYLISARNFGGFGPSTPDWAPLDYAPRCRNAV